MKPANPPLEKAVQPGEASNPDANGAQSTLNSPKVDETSGKPTQRAITTASQAHAIAKNLRDRAKLGRIKTAAVIADKYNGSAPFNESDLSRTGQAWRNNFSTNFLASIIDRVKPQMLDPINKSDVLTHSSLPAKIDNAAIKSRTFCEVTTKAIRSWPGWRDFASQLAQENVVFGHATPGWIDSSTEWRPRLWRYDEAFLPEGTGQHSTSVQVVVFSQKMLLHDFIQLFQDKKLAEKACYNFENCIKAANSTKAQGSSKTGDETDLERVDRIREGNNMADSYTDKARTVDLYHILVRDYTGGVDLWTVTQDDGWEIRNVEDLHDEITDALTLFTFQSGNGKFYGSKGLGRLLTNLHIAIERGRCLGADQMYLSGLVIFKTEKKDAASLQARVRHPFIFVPKDMDVVSEQITFDVQAFEMMDAKLTHLAESIAGAFIPPNLNEQGANTKIEAAQNAEREMAVKEGVLGRFFDHLSDLVGTMQKKMYSSVNLREGKRAYDKKLAKQQTGVMVIMRRVWKLLKDAFGKDNKTEPDIDTEHGLADEAAVNAVVELLENGLTVEDIATLALSPSSQSNATDGAAKDQATMAYIGANVTNPFLDQRAATEMAATIAIGEDRAKHLLIPMEDPQVETIAIRQQLIECGEMNTGEAMPVAASDKHDTHRKIIASKMDGVMAAVQTAPTPAILKIAELFLGHYQQHIMLDTMMPLDQKQAESKAVAQDMATVQKVMLAMQKQQQAAAAQGYTGDPAGLPVPVNGQPPQATGPGGSIPGELGPDGLPLRQSIHPEDAKLRLEVHKAGQEDQRIALAHQQHELEASKIAHQQAMDALKMQQEAAGMVQDSQMAGAQAGAAAGQDSARRAHEKELALAQMGHDRQAQANQLQSDQQSLESEQAAKERLAKLAADNDPAASKDSQ